MYYRIYGVMDENGFNSEEANAGRFALALEAIAKLDPARFPFFAITEHDNSASPARHIWLGLSAERVTCGDYSLIKYQENPIKTPGAARELFSLLKTRAQEVKRSLEENPSAKALQRPTNQLTEEVK